MKIHGDWLPDEMRRFRAIEGIFRRTCLRHGYGEVRTPVIEKLHWFTGAGILSPDLMHKVYTFLDWDGWSGERVVLRPDNTVPVCRLFSEYFAREGRARLFYVEDVFRYDEEQKTGGRHCQMGVELLGNFTSAHVRDVEVLVLLFDFLREIKLRGARIVLSHAGILRAYLKTLNLSREEEEDAFDLLMEGRMQELRKFCADRCGLDGLSRLLELRGTKASFLANLKTLGKASPKFTAAVSELGKIASLLETLGYSFEINAGIHKDLTYYTGMMFDVYAKSVLIGGGGRYDNLLEKFTGGKVGGSGFSLYVEPLMDMVGEVAVASAIPTIRLVADFEKQDEIAEALKAAGALRKKGLSISLSSKGDRVAASTFMGKVGKEKDKYFLIAQSGKKREKFPLPLKSASSLLSFWGVKP